MFNRSPYSTHSIEELGITLDIPTAWDVINTGKNGDWAIRAPEKETFTPLIILGVNSTDYNDAASSEEEAKAEAISFEELVSYSEEALINDYENYKLLDSQQFFLNEGTVPAIMRKVHYTGFGLEFSAAILTTISPYNQYWIIVGSCLRGEQAAYLPIFEHIYRSVTFTSPATPLNDSYYYIKNEIRKAIGEDVPDIEALILKGKPEIVTTANFKRVAFEEFDFSMKVPLGESGWTIGYSDERPLLILAPPEQGYRASLDLQFINFDNTDHPTITDLKEYVKRSQEYVLQNYVEPEVSSVVEDVVIDGQPGVIWFVSSISYQQDGNSGIHTTQERVLIVCDNENPVYMFTIDSLTELNEKYLTIFTAFIDSIEFLVELGEGNADNDEEK